ncbi:MAG: oligosaccharide flippase family protein [Planctomycetes bacterium]|nr:oligosaccharide flippase family protein [Planctomycetota bacterium]
MAKKSSFLWHAAVYGGGNLLVYAAGFLLLPLYVRCLSESEYGTLDVFNRLGEVVILCLLYNGLRQALLAFHNQARDEMERRAVVGSAILLTLLLLGGGGALVMVVASPLSRWLQIENPGLLRLAVASVVLESLALMLLALAQARVESVFFAVVTFGQFLLRVGLSIALVAGFGLGVQGVLIASAVTSALFALVLLGREVVRGGLWIDRRQLKAMTWFALPFVPGGLGFFLLNSGDRFFLLHHVDKAALGAYALGYKLALVVKLFSRRPLYMVWSARMYEAARRPDAPTVFGKVFTRMLAAEVGVGLALCLVAKEAVRFLAGGGYDGAAAVIAPLVFGYLFLTAADLMDAAFYVKRRTAWKTPIMLGSTAVVLALYALLIPPLGIHGAALATLFGFVAHAGLTGVVSQRVFPVRYQWGRVAAAVAWAIVLWFVGQGLPASWWLLPAKAVLWLTWPVGLWHAGVISEEEKQCARAFARTVGEKLGFFREPATGAPELRAGERAA